MPNSKDAIQAKIHLLVNKLDNLKTGYQNDILLLTENFQEEHSKLTGELYDHYRMLEEEQVQEKLAEAEEHHQQQLQEKESEAMLLKEENERLKLMLKQKDNDLEVEDGLSEAERERQRSRRRSFRLLNSELERDDGLPDSPLDPVHAAAFPGYKLPADENERISNGDMTTPTQTKPSASIGSGVGRAATARRARENSNRVAVSNGDMTTPTQSKPSASIGTGVGRAATARRAREKLSRTTSRRRELAFTSRRRLSLQGGAVRVIQSTNQGTTHHSTDSPAAAGSGGDRGEPHDRHRTHTRNWRSDFHRPHRNNIGPS